MNKNANLRTLQSSRKGVAPCSLQTRSWALFYSVRVSSPNIVLAVGKSFIPPLEASARNSQQWDLHTFFRTSSLAFAGDAKELVTSAASRENAREGRVQRLPVLPLWVTSAASKTKEKFNYLPTSVISLGTVFITNHHPFTRASWIRLFICGSTSEATKWQ